MKHLACRWGSSIRSILSIVCFAVLIAPQSWAQTILSQDTTWSAGTPITVDGVVQVAHGVTLTIEPGAVVNVASPYGYGAIHVFGALNVAGTATDKVQLNNVRIKQSGTYTAHSHINISHAIVQGGSILAADGNAAYGSFAFRDSKFSSVEGFYLWYPTADSFIERNIFEDSSGLGFVVTDNKIVIRNNVFVKQKNHSAAIFGNNNDHPTSPVLVERNSFLSVDRVAISGPVTASENYFGTTDETVIQAMIYDRNDSLSANHIVNYKPIQSAPHSDTPAYAFNESPTPIVKTPGGATVILQDTTWSAGTPITVDGEVQVAPGATLTIDPGAVVNAGQYYGAISVFGTLNVAGTATSKVQLNDLRIRQSGTYTANSHINISHAVVQGGTVMQAGGGAEYGSFAFRDSKFSSVEGFYLWYPTADSFVERNIFESSSGLNFVIGGNKIIIRNNVFVKPKNYSAISGNNNDQPNSLVFVERNSFLSVDQVAISGPVTASENYFGATDEAVIQAMIFDRNDNLSAHYIVNYKPIQSAPHPDTPEYVFNESPTPLTKTPNSAMVILQDTTWSAGTPITVDGEVQVAPGATLTIEPGAVVNVASQYSYGAISVFGTLNVAGTAANKVQLNGLRIKQSGTYAEHSHINISHAVVQGGSIMAADGNAAYGSFAFRDSKFSSVEGFYLWYPTADSFVEQNIFEDSAGLFFAVTDNNISIRNNVFVKQKGYAISGTNNDRPASPVLVERNSFLSVDRVAIGGPVAASENYFSTTDEAVIQAMIYDRNDSLSANYIVNYKPIQSAPHPDTPEYLDGAVCGSSHGGHFLSTPQQNLCTLGAASMIEYRDGLYEWSCAANLQPTMTACSASGQPLQNMGQVEVSVGGYSPWSWMITKAAAVSAPAPVPSGATFPYGFAAIELEGGSHGSSAGVTLRFPEPLPANAVYLKFGIAPTGSECQKLDCTKERWYEIPQQISEDRRALTIYLTDGGLGDNDLLENGLIVDPGGVAVRMDERPTAAAHPIPTLSEWSLIALGLLAAGAGAHRLRRRY